MSSFLRRFSEALNNKPPKPWVFGLFQLFFTTISHNIGALHTGPWIRIRCVSGIQIQRPFCPHTASIRIQASRVLCCMIVRKIQFSGAMRVVCVSCGAHTKPHWIWIRNSDPANPVLVPVWRVPFFQDPHPQPSPPHTHRHICIYNPYLQRHPFPSQKWKETHAQFMHFLFCSFSFHLYQS